MGRGWEHFFDESARLIDANGTQPPPDSYRESARLTMLAIEKAYGIDGAQATELPVEQPAPSEPALSKREQNKAKRAAESLSKESPDLFSFLEQP